MMLAADRCENTTVSCYCSPPRRSTRLEPRRGATRWRRVHPLVGTHGGEGAHSGAVALLLTGGRSPQESRSPQCEWRGERRWRMRARVRALDADSAFVPPYSTRGCQMKMNGSRRMDRPTWPRKRQSLPCPDWISGLVVRAIVWA
jgi:hypothetical protein